MVSSEQRCENEYIEPPQSLLKKIWYVFSVFSAVVSLASLVEDIVAWGWFMQDVIAGYRSVVYPIGRLLFGWLYFTVPDWLFDYFTIGVLVGIGLYQGMMEHDNEARKNQGWRLRCVLVLMIALIWPLAIFTMVVVPFSAFEDRQTKLVHVHAWHWLGTVVLCFVVVLLLNYAPFR